MMSGMMPQVREGLTAWRRSGDVSGGYNCEVVGEFSANVPHPVKVQRIILCERKF
jgi:hypothetical protein